MRRAIPVIAVVVYAVADFPAALAGDLAGGVDVSLTVVPFCAAFALAFVPWGRAADRYGAGRVLVAATGALALAGVALVVADTPTALVGARALQGLAAAGFPPAGQALLTRRASGRAGRAVGGMMAGVGVGTLAAPIAAQALAQTGTATALWVLGVVLPAIACAASACLLERGASVPAAPALRAPRLRLTGSLTAGWAVSALVLGAYWTILTRLDDILGPHGAGLSTGGARLLALVAGAVGIAGVALSARASDRRGPRLPMAVVLAAGGVAALAASIGPPALAAAGLAALLGLYWAYLPVVSAQVSRSSSDETRATAVAGLYASMWLGAAGGGLLAAGIPDWRAVLAACAAAWLLAALVAARGFHAAPARTS